jgi:hypothetical protein
MSNRLRYALAVIWLVTAVVAAFTFAFKYLVPHHRRPLWGTAAAVMVALIARLILPEPLKKKD